MTQDLTSHLLRAYFTATDWDPTQSYLHLTSSSSSILLDFPIPAGLSLSLSSCSSPSTFYSTHRLRALPHLAGSLGYVFARTERPLDLEGVAGPASSPPEEHGNNDRLQSVLERFRIVNEPRLPSNSSSASSSRPGRDYLLYGSLHAPSSRLDALYTTRLSPAWNLILTACSFPPRSHSYAPAYMGGAGAGAVGGTGEGSSSAVAAQGPTAPGATNLQVTVQNDTGRWFNEWSYSVDDALWGFRTMHHFGPSSKGHNTANDVDTSSPSHFSSSSSSVGPGLRGRFSAGGELFFSAAEKSAGLSTGVRFTTLPEPHAYVGGAPPSQPPTTITATLNPMMGHMSTAYAAQLGRDVVCCSRYDFNVYSYESELTVGGEFWLRGGGRGTVSAAEKVLGVEKGYERGLVAATREASLRGVTAPQASTSATQGSAPRTEREPVLDSSRNASLRDVPVPVAVERISRPATPVAPAPPSPPSPPSSSVSSPPTPSYHSRTPVSPPGFHAPTYLPVPPTISSTDTTSQPRALLKSSLNLSTLLLSLLYQGSLSNGCIVRVGLRVDLLRGAGASGVGGQGKKKGVEASGAKGILRGVGMEVVYMGGGETRTPEREAGAALRSRPEIIVGRRS